MPLSNHNLNTFIAVAKTLKEIPPNEEETDEEAGTDVVYASVQTPRHNNRRKSARFTLPASTLLSTPTNSGVVVKGAEPRRNPRQSDTVPRLAQSASRRRSLPLRASTANTPVSSQRPHSKSPKRRHTFAFLPNTPEHVRMPSVASGVSEEVQFVPLRQTLSRRTQRSLRRSGLSATMNEIDAEEKAKQQKSQLELEKLRAELAGSHERLKELEQQLDAAKSAPDREEGEEDVDMGMGFEFGDDLTDNTPEHTPEPEVRLAAPTTRNLPRQASSNGAPIPLNPRDQRIKDLEAQIDKLRANINLAAEEAKLRQEDDGNFHNADEQILLEENRSLAQQVENLRSPSFPRVTFRDSSATRETYTVYEESEMSDMSIMTDKPISDNDHNSAGPTTMLMDVDEEEHLQIGDQLNTRILELEELEGERIQNSTNGITQAEGVDETVDDIEDSTEQADTRVLELEADVFELRCTHATITEEKRKLEVTIAELKATIAGLEHSVDAGDLENEESHERVASMQDIIGGLKAQLEENSVAKKEFEEEVQGLDEMIVALDFDVHDLRLENETLGLKVGVKESHIDRLNQEMLVFHARVTNFKIQVEDLTEVLRASREQLSEKEIVFHSLELEHESLESERSGLEVDLDQLETELDTNSQKLEDAYEAIAEKDGEIQKLGRANLFVQEKLADAIDFTNHLQTLLANTIADHEIKALEFETLIDQSVDRAAGLDDLVTKLNADHEGEVEAFQNNIKDADHALHEAKAKSILELASLQTGLATTRADGVRQIQNAESLLAEQKATIAQLVSKLTDRNEEITTRNAEVDAQKTEIAELTTEILQLKEASEATKAGLENEINTLQETLRNVRFQVGKEKVQLEQLVVAHEARISELETQIGELSIFLNEAETHEAELEEKIKSSEVAHQLSADEAAHEKARLIEQKESLQAQISCTRKELETQQTAMQGDISALRGLFDDKKLQIETLRSDISNVELQKLSLNAKVMRLERKKQDLEEDLEEERQKGRETIKSIQQEAEKLASRLGDRKGMYIREQKLRESRSLKRMLSEVARNSTAVVVASSSRVETVMGGSKRRRLDPGVGAEECDDEGFEGSVQMSTYGA